MNINSEFQIRPIDSCIKKRIWNNSFKPDGIIQLDDLSYMTILHYNFHNKICTGELIINSRIASDTLAVFQELYELKYPIEKMILIDEYNSDDDRSMADNNSSAFNYRCIAGTNKLSNHSLGLAIDINPLYNPYVQVLNGTTRILPAESLPYADRSKCNPYYIHKNDACYNAFVKHGFTWGGEWEHSKDYQHFEHK